MQISSDFARSALWQTGVQGANMSDEGVREWSIANQNLLYDTRAVMFAVNRYVPLFIGYTAGGQQILASDPKSTASHTISFYGSWDSSGRIFMDVERRTNGLFAVALEFDASFGSISQQDLLMRVNFAGTFTIQATYQAWKTKDTYDANYPNKFNPSTHSCYRLNSLQIQQGVKTSFDLAAKLLNARQVQSDATAESWSNKLSMQDYTII